MRSYTNSIINNLESLSNEKLKTQRLTQICI